MLSRLQLRRVLVLITLLMLVLSWFAPLFTLTQLWIFEDRVSFALVLRELAAGGQWLLFMLILVASMLLPLIKVLIILLSVARPELYISQQQMEWLARLARWAMLDVWVVALLVVLVKLSAWADAEVGWGLYLQLTVVALMIWQSRWLNAGYRHSEHRR